MPRTKTNWWKNKLSNNKEKDKESLLALNDLGWRVLIIWKCFFRGKGKNRDIQIDLASKKIERWIFSKNKFKEFYG